MSEPRSTAAFTRRARWWWLLALCAVLATVWGMWRALEQRQARQAALQAQDQVAQQHHHGVGQQQAGAIALPGHALLRVDAQGAIGAALQPGMVLAGKAARQPLPHGNGQQRHDGQDHGKFDPG